MADIEICHPSSVTCHPPRPFTSGTSITSATSSRLSTPPPPPLTH
ncbi:hypothetical protein SLNWT_2999 [Streptomyces albus]|uniref:Uncharacterized protein n=1 Tax=Streptomyces albus (strain ATCC 21838 / DSM 41398 / FERM P-419 / JCM 4703 / NBRC 107858) TaxID=1081613 RepID=A0A0B5EVX7_STRA4|nr:hypothetical protein SLNWT_2999 [Streptomyces albus]AOU77685.1 hypothetical protein SLNHY_2994 [Streptomyces albus]